MRTNVLYNCLEWTLNQWNRGGPANLPPSPEETRVSVRDPKPFLPDPASVTPESTLAPTHFKDRLPSYLDAAGNPAAEPVENLPYVVFQCILVADNRVLSYVGH